MQGYHSNQTSLKDQFIGLVTIIAMFLGGTFLYATWPWWLILIPFSAALILLSKPRLRRDIVPSHTKRKVSSDIGKLRTQLIGWFTVLGMVTALICLAADNMEWWLIPLFLAAIAFRLGERSLDEDRPSLVRSVCANLFELSLLACLVLMLYLLAEIWLLGVPLDDKTLHWLIKWQDNLENTHEFIEDHAPRWWIFLFAVILSGALRILASSRPAFAGFSKRTIAILTNGFKWLARLSTITALAASLTLLATDKSGLSERISLTLRDAKKSYEEFTGRISTQTDALLRQSLSDRAWRQRPAALKAEMADAVKIIRARGNYEEKRREARDSFQVSLQQTQFVSATPDLNSRHVIDLIELDEIPTSLTPRDIQRADQEAEASPLPSSNIDSSKAEDGTEELARKTFEKILSDQLSKNSAPLKLVKAHFPVVGEFVDAILASVSETAFARSRDVIVRHVIKQKLIENNDVPLASMMKAEVTEISKGYDFNLKGFDFPWRSKTSEVLSHYSHDIESALYRLEALSVERQRKSIRAAGQEAHQRAHLLSEVGTAMNDPLLRQQSKAIERYSDQLATAGEKWPALYQPPSNLRREFNAVSTQMSNDKLLASQVVIEYPHSDKPHETNSHLPIVPLKQMRPSPKNSHSEGDSYFAFNPHTAPISPTNLNLWDLMKRNEVSPKSNFRPLFDGPTDPRIEMWRNVMARQTASILSEHTSIEEAAPRLRIGETPLQAIRELSSYCDEQMIQIVATSHDYQDESIKLRSVLGDRYYSAYYQVWLDRKRAAEAAAEAARQESVRQAAREEFHREQEREREYREAHPVEHFEVP